MYIYIYVRSERERMNVIFRFTIHIRISFNYLFLNSITFCCLFFLGLFICRLFPSGDKVNYYRNIKSYDFKCLMTNETNQLLSTMSICLRIYTSRF